MHHAYRKAARMGSFKNAGNRISPNAPIMQQSVPLMRKIPLTISNAFMIQPPRRQERVKSLIFKNGNHGDEVHQGVNQGQV